MLESLMNLFFPKVCAGCNSFLLSDEKVICTRCRHEIPLTNHHKTKNNEAFNKFYGRIDLEYASALFYFNKKGIVQEMIHKLKYKGHQEVGEAIGNCKEIEYAYSYRNRKSKGIFYSRYSFGSPTRFCMGSPWSCFV